MTNPRRRRTVIVVVTAGFILLAQLPNLINIWRARGTSVNGTSSTTRRNEQQRSGTSRPRRQEDHARGVRPAARRRFRRSSTTGAEAESQRTWQRDRADRPARQPGASRRAGWRSGRRTSRAGRWSPALLGTLGFGLIGGVQPAAGVPDDAPAVHRASSPGEGAGRRRGPRAPVDPSRVRLVERRLPWVSEHASAVATAAFRSLTRAPEAKMALLAPVIMLVVFGGGRAVREGGAAGRAAAR